MNTSLSSFNLFGASKPFIPPAWSTSDDRVRGGASQSYLIALPDNRARFYGHLDASTLGGAGFASQFSPLNVPALDDQSKEGKQCWNLAAYDGIEIGVEKSDDKVYTFILRDEEQVEKREDGREKAGINWEVEFRAGKSGDGEVDEEKEMKIWLPWSEFKATFRGKEKKDAGKLKTGEISRVGLMMRRQVLLPDYFQNYFGKQEGDFNLELRGIRARKRASDQEQASNVAEAQKSIFDARGEQNQQSSSL
ncbi:hypothetical protein ACLMJK_004128 [Lecanora helva]